MCKAPHPRLWLLCTMPSTQPAIKEQLFSEGREKYEASYPALSLFKMLLVLQSPPPDTTAGCLCPSPRVPCLIMQPSMALVSPPRPRQDQMHLQRFIETWPWTFNRESGGPVRWPSPSFQTRQATLSKEVLWSGGRERAGEGRPLRSFDRGNAVR